MNVADYFAAMGFDSFTKEVKERPSGFSEGEGSVLFRPHDPHGVLPCLHEVAGKDLLAIGVI